MVAPAEEGIDLFKIANRSISGWIPSFKMGATSPVKQPFCSQLEERLLLWLEYHPQVKSYAPAFAEIVLAVQEIWPWGEVASVEELESRLTGRWPANLVEATIWKLVGDNAAAGHLLVDLEQHTLDRTLLLALLPPDAPTLVPDPLPDSLEPVPDATRLSSVSLSPPAREPALVSGTLVRLPRPALATPGARV